MAQIRDQLPNLPTSPGVYIFRDRAGKALYIGKAENLRARVRQYLQTGGDGRQQIPFLMSKAHDVEVVTTATNTEAVLLERTLVHEQQPRYNIELRDDKSFLSLRLDLREAWPWFRKVRTHGIKQSERRDPNILLFGPYANAGALHKTVRLLSRLFPLRTCSDGVFRNRTRPCLQHQIGRCVAPCVLDVDPAEYREMLDQAVLFLRGDTDKVIKRLRAQMDTLSESMDFEKAAALRDRISAVETSTEQQRMVSHARDRDLDVIALAREEGQVLLAVFRWRAGVLMTHRSHTMTDHGLTNEWLFHEFLSRVYPEEGDIPGEVLIQTEPHESAMIEQDLRERAERAVSIHAPQRGEKRRLIEMAVTNAEQMLHQRVAGARDVDATLAQIQKRLKLPSEPRWIECFDISTLQGAMTVGSQVSFRDGEPDKSGYRLYRVQTLDGQDDFAAMHEVLSRRFRRAMQQQEDLPDLVIIDGGKGQLGMAMEALHDLGVEGVPVVGLAKSRAQGAVGPQESMARSPERIFLPGRKNPVIFRPHEPALHLIARIRDEAHRTAIGYHRKLRRKANLRSLLDEIPGVGPGRRRVLLRHFGSLAKIRVATVEELLAAPGINRALAKTIHHFLNAEE